MNRLALIALLALAACGKQGGLTPVPPRPAPLQASDAIRPATPTEMLVLPPQSLPNRVDDPLLRSQDRPDDRFNLPPPGTR
ncbi:hypothetical protein GCM10011529_27050 [Polymorphobacter glacialis]|uniref:Uncharacterized protein n=1 Tax=Sandarakinorhabdus glacialis TaxID=1614636 RepID=A0A917EBP3_9SPHN|nr:hypothetical protein [Polymorphobacter glacialis]GGE19123.1 hypothetical protein GCM10011529_27050 [Polymorphobacter glacialis]